MPSNRLVTKLKWWLWKLDWHCNFSNSRLKKELKEILQTFQPDVIHLQFAFEALKFLDNIDFPFDTPIIIHFHGYGASQMLRKQSYIKKIRKYLEYPNIYPIYVSSFMKSKLEKSGINCDKGLLLRCGIDLTKFDPERKENKADSETKIFLQVSSLAEKKGHEYTLKAFARFLEKQKERNQFKLILTGDGKRKDYLASLARDLNIHERVDFVGFVSHDQAVKLMVRADYFVHHSITAENGDQEGIPNAIMEAMAMELPIISTYHAGIPELVEDGVNGYLVEEKDVVAYAKRLEDILSWDRCPQNRAKINLQYELNKHNSMLENFYTEIVRQNKISND